MDDKVAIIVTTTTQPGRRDEVAARILTRQATEVTEPALVTDLDQQWRTVTSADGPLASCRH